MMRKRIILAVGVAALSLQGCDKGANGESSVDTTLPNDTAAIPSVDINTTEGADSMTDNMTAVDGAADQAALQAAQANLQAPASGAAGYGLTNDTVASPSPDASSNPPASGM